MPGPWGKGQRGVRGSLREQSVSVSCLQKPRRWDLWDASVRLCRGQVAAQTGALVRALCVAAQPVLTQGHLVTDVLTLVYICRKRRHEVSTEISQLKQLPAPHLLLSGLMGI